MFRFRAIALLVFTVSTLAFAACAQGQRPQWPSAAVATLAPAQSGLEVRGPGTIFESVEAAAIDALIYAHREARTARETDRTRGGTIYRAGRGYSYDEIHVAAPLAAHRVTHTLGPRDVARFLVYPRVGKHEVDRANERPSPADRRFVSAVDPLHRPLYILHPSLAIRVYRGEGRDLEDVVKLRRSKWFLFVAGN